MLSISSSALIRNSSPVVSNCAGRSGAEGLSGDVLAQPASNTAAATAHAAAMIMGPAIETARYRIDDGKVCMSASKDLWDIGGLSAQKWNTCTVVSNRRPEAVTT